MKILDNSSAGLNRQILVVTLLPLLLLSLTLATYFILTRLADTEQLMLERGQTISKLIASNAKKAMLQDDQNAMKALSKIPLDFDDVSDIIFLDTRYNILTREDTFALDLKPTSPSSYRSGEYWYFVQPVSTKTQIPSLFNTTSQKINSTETIGWVIVLLCESPTTDRQQQIVITGSGIILMTLLFAFWFAHRFAQQIMTPILEITSVVEAFQQGNFDARARESHAGKLHALAKGINRMAMRVKVSTTDMKTRVDSATRRLQSAMHHLEQQNETLETTKEKEVEANQAKDQFLARMSHELRTPLTSVLGFSKILQETSVSEEQAEPIRIINHTSQLLLSIVDDILDYSKLQKDAITLERIDFNIETALLDTLEMQAPMAHSKGLDLSLVSCNNRSFNIKGDPTRFKQIINNLVSNAVKFTDQGAVALSLDIQHINRHQSLIIISVTDTGIGISDKQLNKLFKAFVQADTSITRRFGGSGLGLVIAKNLTKLMGGKLEIYSKLGKGTNVTLQIPTLLSSFKEDPTSEVLELTDPVLVYDDNIHTRRSIAQMLERKRIEHYLVSNKEDLLNQLPNYKYAVIGIQSTDLKNTLLANVMPLITATHKNIIFALPNSHPLPQLSANVSVINKPIRPETFFHKNQNHNIDDNINPEDFDLTEKICAVVAEDNNFNQLLIAKILEKHNIECHIASNGEEALSLIQKFRPDIAILDIHMPIMDGFEATKIIRQTSNLPIIALTANIIEQDHHRIIQAGSNRIILKPINDVELISHIRILTKTAKKNKSKEKYQTSSLVATNISEYNLDQTLLARELRRLLSLLELSFKTQDNKAMRSITHQLLGLAGLYELPEVEVNTISLQNALKNNNTRHIWNNISRLIRIIRYTEEKDNLALKTPDKLD